MFSTVDRQLTYATYQEKNRTIQQVLEFTESMGNAALPTFCVLATISDIDVNRGWKYPACGGTRKCKKMLTNMDGVLFCTACSKPATKINIRYRIEIEVEDASAFATFVLFNTEAKKLLNISAEDLAEKYPEVEDKEPIFPSEVQSLVGSTHLFDIKLTEYNRTATRQTFTIDYVQPPSAVPIKPPATDEKDGEAHVIAIDSPDSTSPGLSQSECAVDLGDTSGAKKRLKINNVPTVAKNKEGVSSGANGKGKNIE